MTSYTAQTRSPPTDDVLSMVLDPQFVRFLPRRIEDSATVIWVYLYKQCDFVETFFQRESNVWNSATFGLFFQMDKIHWKTRSCYLTFTALTQNQKMHYCVIQLRDHQIVESGGSNSKQSKKFTEKSVGFL